MMRSTPYAHVNSLLDDLLSRMREVLRDKLVGLYLYGSLRTGDFDPEISDIDLLAALRSDLTRAEFKDLHRMHGNLARDYPAWDDRIEVGYLSLEGLKTFRHRSSPMAVISPGEPFHFTQAGHDYLMNWYLVRETGLALLGPPPEHIIDPIGREEFLRALRDYVKWDGWKNYVQGQKGQAYTILTMCRALYAHRHGEHVSKSRAAAWAQKELPEWSGLIGGALEWRQGRGEEAVDHTATRKEAMMLVDFIRAEISGSDT